MVFVAFGPQRGRQIQAVIGRNAEIIARVVRIVRHNQAVVAVAAVGKGGCGAGEIGEVGGERPFLVQFIYPHHRKVVRAVILGRVPLIVVDAVNLAFGARKRIADPAGEFARVFLHKKLHSVGAAIAVQQIAFQIRIQQRLRPVYVVNLVGHVFVIHFHRSFKPVVFQVPEIAQGHLVGNFGLDVGGAGLPDIQRIGGGSVGNQVNVLCHAVVAQLQRTIVVQAVFQRGARLQVGIRDNGLFAENPLIHGFFPVFQFARVLIHAVWPTVIKQRQPQSVLKRDP